MANMVLKKLSTPLAVFSTENITESLDEDEYTFTVLIDPHKAFDTLNHRTVLKILWYNMGSVLNWVESYILGRYQYVHYNDKS